MANLVFYTRRMAIALLAALACVAIGMLGVPGTAFADDDLDAYADSSKVAVFRLYDRANGVHFYTADVGERDALTRKGWSFEGVGWVAPAEGDDVYRLCNLANGVHFFTANADEREGLLKSGWRDEGVAWKSGGLVPVRRTQSRATGAHLFTADNTEASHLVTGGWNDEGFAWYAVGMASPVYRLCNRTSGVHLYTANASEKDALRKSGWRDEGIGWFAPTKGTSVHRVCSPDGTHFFTSDEKEKDALVAKGWRDEGVAWKSGGSMPVYRDFGPATGVHNFTASEEEHAALLAGGWRGEGVAWKAVAGPFVRTADAAYEKLNLIRDIRGVFDHGYKGAEYQKYIVLHDTEGNGRGEDVVDWWASNGNMVAAHFIVNKDGSIVQCGEIDRILHHAGYGDRGHNAYYGTTDESRDDKRGTVSIGSWAPDYGMNSYSIGIEIVHVGGSGGYPAAQLEALDDLIAYIDAYYGFESRIIDHKAWRSGNSDTSPEFATYLWNYQRGRSYKG